MGALQQLFSMKASLLFIFAFVVVSVFAGTNGRDILRGTNDDDVLYGCAGNDRIFPGSGGDFVNGGFGNDEIILKKDDRGSASIIDGFGVDQIKIRATNKAVTLQLTNDLTSDVIVISTKTHKPIVICGLENGFFSSKLVQDCVADVLGPCDPFFKRDEVPEEEEEAKQVTFLAPEPREEEKQQSRGIGEIGRGALLVGLRFVCNLIDQTGETADFCDRIEELEDLSSSYDFLEQETSIVPPDTLLLRTCRYEVEIAPLGGAHLVRRFPGNNEPNRVANSYVAFDRMPPGDFKYFLKNWCRCGTTDLADNEGRRCSDAMRVTDYS